MKLLCLLFLLSAAGNAFAVNYKWIRTSRNVLRGQALVAHGLNSNPAKMLPMISELNKRGHDVLLLELSGHENLKSAEAHSATYGEWYIELTTGFDLLTSENRRKGGTTTFVGFSLGSLLGLNTLARANINIVDQMILFAPPINVNKTIHFGMPLYFLMHDDNKVMPTGSSSREHIVLDGPKIAGYKVLMRALQEFKNTPKSSLNVPTVIFVNPKDEVVSVTGLNNFAGGMLDWRVIDVSTNGSTVNKSHHSVYAPELLGPNEWNRRVVPELDKMLGN